MVDRLTYKERIELPLSTLHRRTVLTQNKNDLFQTIGIRQEDNGHKRQNISFQLLEGGSMHVRISESELSKACSIVLDEAGQRLVYEFLKEKFE